MANSDLQTYLFEEINSRHFNSRSAMIEALMQLFEVQKDAIYRRLRCETMLTPNEMTQLAQTYNISLDSYVFGRTDALFFTFNPFVKKVKNIEDFLEGIHQDVALLNRLPDVHIYNAWAEIPFFFYMFFPKLFSFKMYVYGRTIWQIDYLQNRPFDFDILPTPVIQKAKDILTLYRAIPTTELWSLNIMDNTLNQIEYHANSSGFKNAKDALVLCQDMTELANHMEAMAIHGKKCAISAKIISNGGAFTMYHNEMIYTNNTIFVTSSVGRSIYTTYGNPNFLKTTDERLCDYTADWFNSVVSKSLDMHNERGRQYFFDRLRKRIDYVRIRIEKNLMEEDER